MKPTEKCPSYSVWCGSVTTCANCSDLSKRQSGEVVSPLDDMVVLQTDSLVEAAVKLLLDYNTELTNDDRCEVADLIQRVSGGRYGLTS